jgi:anti-anti-sigma factor
MRPNATARFEIPARILRWPECDALGNRLISLIHDRECKKLILDFGLVDSMTATALGSLIAVRNELLSRGKKMIIRNVRPQVYEVLRVARVAKLFDARAPLARRRLRCEG